MFFPKKKKVLKNEGVCPCCDKQVVFSSENEWLRDYYLCPNCKCLPRERALLYCLEKFYPDWRGKRILEASPSQRGASVKISRECENYYPTYYLPEEEFGKLCSGKRNENLESLTFQDASFDLVITQDVMEHIFYPEKAFAHIARVLRKGGAHIFTVPLVNKNKPSEICAEERGGEIVFLKEPEYHEDAQKSLVTRHWGYDICDFIYKSSGLSTTIAFIDDLRYGIRAEYIEVLISRKM